MLLKRLLSFVVFILSSGVAFGQITAPSSDFQQSTAYTDGASQDVMYFFCSSQVGLPSGSLQVSSGTETTFVWSYYSAVSGLFTPFLTENGSESFIENLDDGAYRVEYSVAGTDYVYTTWVFSNALTFELAVVERTCDYTRFESSVTSPDTFTYYNLSNATPVVLANSYSYVWSDGDINQSKAQNPSIYDPPAVDTNYACTITDITGCSKEETILYESIVPFADFTWSHDQEGSSNSVEAPLEVFFENNSDNGDEFLWSLYKSDEDLYEEGIQGPILDSLLTSFTEENPVYVYNSTGTYRVKLHVTKINDSFLCKDSVFLEEPISIDTSLVSVAPVLTPNADGINDYLVIKTRSLESLDFQVFNRWGKRVHRFNKNGFIPADAELAAWDGKINGKVASEGVYFYVVDARGRDDKIRRTKGFVHLFD